MDTGDNVIARSMQLVAGRTAQEYNHRNGRLGTFWEDRYHASAIEAHAHLHRCLVYIELNMVWPGAARHPADWLHRGYAEIQNPPQRYRLIVLEALSGLCGFDDVAQFQRAHRNWVEAELAGVARRRDERWSEAIAVGSEAFVHRVKDQLALKAKHRQIVDTPGAHVLRESAPTYGGHFGLENGDLSPENRLYWDVTAKVTGA